MARKPWLLVLDAGSTHVGSDLRKAVKELCSQTPAATRRHHKQCTRSGNDDLRHHREEHCSREAQWLASSARQECRLPSTARPVHSEFLGLIFDGRHLVPPGRNHVQTAVDITLETTWDAAASAIAGNTP